MTRIAHPFLLWGHFTCVAGEGKGKESQNFSSQVQSGYFLGNDEAPREKLTPSINWKGRASRRGAGALGGACGGRAPRERRGSGDPLSCWRPPTCPETQPPAGSLLRLFREKGSSKPALLENGGSFQPSSLPLRHTDTQKRTHRPRGVSFVSKLVPLASCRGSRVSAPFLLPLSTPTLRTCHDSRHIRSLLGVRASVFLVTISKELFLRFGKCHDE